MTLGYRTANICQESILQRMHLFPDKIKDSPLWLYFMQKLFISAASQKIEKKATLTLLKGVQGAGLGSWSLVCTVRRKPGKGESHYQSFGCQNLSRF